MFTKRSVRVREGGRRCNDPSSIGSKAGRCSVPASVGSGLKDLGNAFSVASDANNFNLAQGTLGMLVGDTANLFGSAIGSIAGASPKLVSEELATAGDFIKLNSDPNPI